MVLKALVASALLPVARAAWKAFSALRTRERVLRLFRRLRSLARVRRSADFVFAINYLLAIGAIKGADGSGMAVNVNDGNGAKKGGVGGEKRKAGKGKAVNSGRMGD